MTCSTRPKEELMGSIERAAMALMDKMSADGHEVSYAMCREYAALALAASGVLEPTTK